MRGAQAFDNLLFGKNVTMHCCEKLVEIGRPFHINMIKALFSRSSDEG